MHIAELDKPAGVECKHLVEGGCGIYPTPEDPVDKRPVGCQIFSCLWMSGKGDVNDRTSLMGIPLVLLCIPTQKIEALGKARGISERR